ncbi:MAG: protein-L-isoaspartate O-methyltransferase [Gammaproteobacteria bacterium]
MSLDLEVARFNMVEQQIRPWEVLDARVLHACTAVHRELFVPEAYRNLAFSDTSIAIGHGQHMMQPKVEARMLQTLAIEPGDRILEIGTGSGYVTALLASLGAHVTSIECFEDLSLRAKDNLRHAGIANIKLHVGDAIDGWPTAEPYDVIAVTGSCPTRRTGIEQQLAIGGRLFVVLGQPPVMEATLVTRLSKDSWTTEGLFETDLAPLIGAEARPEFEF